MKIVKGRAGREMQSRFLPFSHDWKLEASKLPFPK
jgi:hypothetical protein